MYNMCPGEFSFDNQGQKNKELKEIGQLIQKYCHLTFVSAIVIYFNPIYSIQIYPISIIVLTLSVKELHTSIMRFTF